MAAALSCKLQLRYKLCDQEAKKLLPNSVYLFSIEGNDYLKTYGEKASVFDSYIQQELVDMVISNITAAIQGVYEEGARKFRFLTLPPLGCWPSIREVNGDCLENVTAIVQLHNEAIFKSIKQLEQQLEGFVYSKLNHYNFFSEIMNNPSKYGLEEGMTACCGSGPYRGVYSCGGKRGMKEYELCNNPNGYLFFDSNHPTETVYEQLAMLMWSGKSSVVGPNNLKSLFEDAQLQKI